MAPLRNIKQDAFRQFFFLIPCYCAQLWEPSQENPLQKGRREKQEQETLLEQNQDKTQVAGKPPLAAATVMSEHVSKRPWDTKKDKYRHTLNVTIVELWLEVLNAITEMKRFKPLLIILLILQLQLCTDSTTGWPGVNKTCLFWPCVMKKGNLIKIIRRRMTRILLIIQ